MYTFLEESYDGVVARELNWDPEDPGSNPYSAMMLPGWPVSHSQSYLPHRVVLRTKRIKLCKPSWTFALIWERRGINFLNIFSNIIFAFSEDTRIKMNMLNNIRSWMWGKRHYKIKHGDSQTIQPELKHFLFRGRIWNFQLLETLREECYQSAYQLATQNAELYKLLVLMASLMFQSNWNVLNSFSG